MIAQEGPPQRILIAGVGYTFLRDWSVGPKVAAQLKAREWPSGVEVDDWSFGPLDAVHKLQVADPPYTRVVFFGTVQRGRPPGTVVRRRWERSQLPDAEEIQLRMGEAISGVISLDNLVFVCAALGALPEDVVLIEIEPETTDEWGDGFSARVEAALPQLVSYIESEAALASKATMAYGDHQ